MSKNPTRPVQTTASSIQLVETIKELDGATVGSLATETGLARSTVHNHLQTLLDAEYVIKENNTYHIGLRLLHLGEYARRRKKEYVLAKKAVQKLATETQIEADFNVEEHGRLINLYDSVGHASDPGWEVGTYFFMHSTSAGKAMLADLPDERVDEIIETHGLPEMTEHTICDREELFAELERIRDRGYAVNEDECFSGYKTIGRAVHYPDGSLFGGLAVGGPSYMIGEEFDQSTYERFHETVDRLETDVRKVLLEG